MTPTETFARTVAALLPGRWRFNAIDSKIDGACWRESIVIHSTEDPGRRITLADDWKDESRWKINGMHAHHNNSITVAKSRTAKAITQDIERRFLADYLTEYADWKHRQDLEKHARDDYKIKRDLIINTFGGSEIHHDNNRIHTMEASVCEAYDGRWSLQTTIKYETLIKVLCLIKQEEPQTVDPRRT